MQHVIVLGAGASKADGAPLQFDLLRDYFVLEKANLQTPMNAELRSFFDTFYGIDITAADAQHQFPTFEEVLGTLELALARNENFRIPGTNVAGLAEQRSWDQRRIQQCREYVVTLICTVLARKLGAGPGPGGGDAHRLLVQNLPRTGNASFISFNYDLLIDNAIANDNRTIDYGTAFANPVPTADTPVGLYKLHGSLNWLRCPICGSLTQTGNAKGASYPVDQRLRCATANCDSQTTPIVIPPTFFKAMSDFHLQQIWNAAEKRLLAADRIYFCGYSLPEADMHIRYLLKRTEVNRGSTPEVFIMTNHPAKAAADKDQECKRYKRLFRNPKKVVYTSWSFEQFARDPFGVANLPRIEVEWLPD